MNVPKRVRNLNTEHVKKMYLGTQFIHGMQNKIEIHLFESNLIIFGNIAMLCCNYARTEICVVNSVSVL